MEEPCVIFSPFSGWKRFSRKLLKTCGEGLSGSCAKELDNKSISQGKLSLHDTYSHSEAHLTEGAELTFLIPPTQEGRWGEGPVAGK